MLLLKTERGELSGQRNSIEHAIRNSSPYDPGHQQQRMEGMSESPSQQNQDSTNSFFCPYSCKIELA